jgi:hypothetical protein
MRWGARTRSGTIPVPPAGAPWDEISAFALTFNGYQRLGGFRNVSQLNGNALGVWQEEGTLPDNIDELRAIVFFEQRTWHHIDVEPHGEDRRFVDAVLEELRFQSGGEVDGPADPPYDGSHRPKRHHTS